MFSYLTDIHMESVTHSAPESFGHVMVKEQFTATYHQETYYTIAEQKEQATRIGASATKIISLESSTNSPQSSSEIMEEYLATNLRTQYSLSCSTDQKRLSKENQDTSLLQSSGSQVNENHSLKDNHMTLERDDDHQSQLLAVDKPVMDCYSNAKNELEQVESLKEEAHIVEGKNGLINKPCEGLRFTEEIVGDTQLRASVNSDPISCTENSTPKVDISPVNVVNTTLPIELRWYLENGVSETACNRNPQMSPDLLNFDIAHQSCSSQVQYQCSPETICTNVPPLLGSREMVNSVSLEGEEELNNDLLVLSHPQTTPLCRTSIDNLPTFNSQRPACLPTERGRSFSPWNTSTMSSQRYFIKFVFVFLP